MRTYLYLSTAVAGVIMATGNALGHALGQCVVTQDCAAMGYTKSSCPDGNGVKCPFGNSWYCGGGAAEDCIKLGYDKSCTGAGESGSGETCNGKYQSCSCDSSYKYTCSGTGYSGGVGTACGGKYTKCNCSSNYSWNGSSCALSCSSSYKYTCSGTGYSGGSGTACGGKYTKCNCASGYEWKDGSCQQQVLNGAVGDLYYCNGKVVGVKASGMSFYVAMKDLGRMNWSSANSQCRNYSFCGNVKGTLPTKDQLLTLYNNKSRVNSLLSTNGGTQLTNNYYWSSTGNGRGSYYIVDMSNGSVGGGYNANNYNNYYVRPVLASW